MPNARTGYGGITVEDAARGFKLKIGSIGNELAHHSAEMGFRRQALEFAKTPVFGLFVSKEF